MKRPWTPEEDAQLKKLAGGYPAEKIGAMLGRPKNGVHHRIAKLKLSGRITGEAHWAAKLPNVTAEMIKALGDAGFTIGEIHRVISAPVDISLQTVSDIAGDRTRRSAV